ncbi:hypothetical protein AQ475_12590 [Burkholderia thailandensis]|nr:hypothetical protein AQ475_12590 [Burkholderia thailandensis]
MEVRIAQDRSESFIEMAYLASTKILSKQPHGIGEGRRWGTRLPKVDSALTTSSASECLRIPSKLHTGIERL